MLFTALCRSLIVAAAIASTASAQIVGPNAVSIPCGVTSYFGKFDEGARAAGLTPLRETPLRPGDREVRIWIQIEISASRLLYRITETGGRVRGELVDCWPASADSHYWQKGRCGEFTGTEGTEACRVRFVKDPGWKRVPRTAEAHGPWRAPMRFTA